MKRISFQPLPAIVLLAAILFFGSNGSAQSDVLVFDFTGSTTSSCSGDNTYSGNSGDESLSGTGITLGATISSISLDANYGVTGFFGTPTGNVEFFLNGNDIGGFTNFHTSCNSGSIPSIDPSFFNAEGPNEISYTTTGSGFGSSRRVYNVTLTINYSVCAPPEEPEVPVAPIEYCLLETADPLTATGSDLLWYESPDDNSGSPVAPVPPTGNAGTTTYYVTQTIGCESERAEVLVTINALPASSIADMENVTCFGGSDGSITVHAIGGSGNGYSFSKDNGLTWFTAEDEGDTYKFEGLVANQAYKIRVKDSNGCESKSVQ